MSPAAAAEIDGATSSESTQQAFLQSHEESVAHSLRVGVVAGTTCVLVGYPLDTMKVRLQSGKFSTASPAPSAGASAARAVFTGQLFKGISAPLLGVVPSWAISFTFYGAALKYLESDSISACALAGAVAGFGYSLVMCPLELVKVNCQVQKQDNAWRMARSLMDINSAAGAAPANGSYRLNPLAQAVGFYRGYAACFSRDVAQGVAYYSLAEYLNRNLTVYLGDTLAPVVAGALTGVGHCTVEYPFDCVKTVRQTVLAAPLSSTARPYPPKCGGGAASATVLTGAPLGNGGSAASSMAKSYGDILKEVGENADLRRTWRRGYFVSISRAVVAHGASFSVLNAVRDWL